MMHLFSPLFSSSRIYCQMILRRSATLAVINPRISVHFEQLGMSTSPISSLRLRKRVDDFDSFSEVRNLSAALRLHLESVLARHATRRFHFRAAINIRIQDSKWISLGSSA